MTIGLPVLLATVLRLAQTSPQEGEANIDVLVKNYEQLMSQRSSTAKRSNAVYQIGMQGGDQGVQALLNLLPTMTPSLKPSAVHAISLAESSRVEAEVRKLCASHDPSIEAQALRCMAHLGIDAQKWLSKRWHKEKAINKRLIILNSLLENQAEGLDSLVLKAAKDDEQQIQIAGLKGIGQLSLDSGYSILRDAATNPIIAIRRTAFSALGQFGGKKAFRTLIAASDDKRNDYIMSSVLKALNSANTEEEVKELLKALNTRDSLMQERLLEALAAAARHQPEIAAKGLRKSLASNEFRVRSAAIRGLVVAKPNDVVSLMLKRLSHRHSATRTDALWALSVLGDIPPEAELKLVELSKSKDGPSRLHATASLGWLATDLAHATCLARLADDWWAVRSAAIESLLKMRKEGSVQQLISLSQRESGRVKSEAIETLCLLTGMDFRGNAGAWRSWWSDRKPGYRLPSRAVAEQMLVTARGKVIRNGDTGTYHGVPVPEGGVIFVLDTSGSMGSRFSAKETYLTHFVAALQKTLKSLPASQEFGVVLFGSNVQAWKNQLVSASPENIEEAIKFLANARAAGGTNLFDAMETSLFFENVQTIFLLTDGQPTMGKRTATSDILNELGRLNRDLKVRINTIAAGKAAADFMEELARNSGGKAVDLTNN